MREKAEPGARAAAAGRPADVDRSGENHYAAVRQLFHEHNRALVKFLMTRLSSEQEALDVAQEAYVRLLQLHEPAAVGFLRGYLFRIAANLSIDQIRHRATRDRTEGQLFEEFSDASSDTRLTEHEAITRQEFELACRALAEVAPKPRRAFVLRFVEGFSTREIAQTLQVDERTVRKYLTQALLLCRRRMSTCARGQT